MTLCFHLLSLQSLIYDKLFLIPFIHLATSNTANISAAVSAVGTTRNA